jgi:RND superfamily putative drug exporter
MVGGLAHSGRVIFTAGAVMVAVFLTFALSGPLPPKEMGSSSASRCRSTRCSCG